MHVLSHSETLLFYDVPELFVAHDQLGTAYVCLLVELDEETHKYLCVPISRDRLLRLLDAELDLRHVLESPETGEAFEGRAISGDLGRIETEALPLDEIPEDWFPAPGFLLDLEPAPDIGIVDESRKRNRAVIHYTLRPPESVEESKISAVHLSEGVNRFQKLLQWAYSKAMRDIGGRVREEISSTANYELEVFAFSPGSFTIHMQTVAQADLVGYSHIARALEILDEVSYEDQDIENAVEVVAHYGGHFATQYKNLLKFIVDNEIPVSYEWSMPKRPDSTRRDLRPRYAKPLYEALVKRSDIGREEKRLLGILTKVDIKGRTWRLLDQEDQEHTGYWDRSSRVTLAGLVIETQRYEFICEERLEEERATGKEFTKLFLIDYDVL
jgi:class 3 adenylate cyclase